MIAGYLLVNTMVAARRDSQDCYRPGGSNCTAGYTPSSNVVDRKAYQALPPETSDNGETP
jgi:hypothetical protein